MSAAHLEILVEEPSMEAFLTELLPRVLPRAATFSIHAHQGKHDLLAKLVGRLRAYSRWLPASMRIIVLVDRDDDDCHVLKRRLEDASIMAGLRTRSVAQGQSWQVANRIAIEELEAWRFGEWSAVRSAYPRAPAKIPDQAAYRAPDAIAGGTWEALERILKRAGYFGLGLRKVEAATAIARHLNPAANTSPSFKMFRDAILEAVAL